MRILLIEPNYKTKYPPLGLMKISSYHKMRGDEVVFFKGKSEELRAQIWDRIYIASLFTFHYQITIDTINFYKTSVHNYKNLIVGGVLATIEQNQIEKETLVNVVPGLLNIKGKLGFDDDDIIDCLTPDYSIINKSSNTLLNYEYPTSDSYIAYATRGCIRRCSFCAVPIIEGKFHNSYSIKSQVQSIEAMHGPKRHLLLLDNNVLAAEEHFFDIINDIVSLGFEKGAKAALNTKGKSLLVNRYVDFNQGIDARLLVKDKRFFEALSRIAISPLRIAFDSIKDKEIYCRSVRMAAEYGIKVMSNYILYNYEDTPEDFYDRLFINIELNDEFQKYGIDSRIWSFPMRYTPIFGPNSKNRKFVGKHWTKKQLRGIQNILSATHGVVGPRKLFFQTAFGKNLEEFLGILQLPENYIIYRKHNLENGNQQRLKQMLDCLDEDEKSEIQRIISSNNFNHNHVETHSSVFNEVLGIYKDRKSIS